MGEQILDQAGLWGGRNLCGRNSSLDLVGLVSRARVVLGVDSAFAQYAYWLGTPAVTVFATVRPDWWGPATPAAMHPCIWTGHVGDPYAVEDCLALEGVPSAAVTVELDLVLEWTEAAE